MKMNPARRAQNKKKRNETKILRPSIYRNSKTHTLPDAFRVHHIPRWKSDMLKVYNKQLRYPWYASTIDYSRDTSRPKIFTFIQSNATKMRLRVEKHMER